MRLARVPSVLRSRWSILCPGVIAVALLSPSFGCGGDKPSKPVVVNVQPSTATMQVGQTQQFTATATGTSSQAVTWAVDGGAVNGTIDALGLYAAPAAVPTPATVTVRATSQADPGRSGTATVTVTPLVTVEVSPPTASLQTGQTQQFTAAVTGTANTAVTWSVDGGATKGTVSGGGLYTAPATVPSPPTVTVRATSQANPAVSGTAAVTVATAPVRLVRIDPGTFQMGSPTNETFRDADETQHWVQITKPFLMGETEVTQAQWQAVTGTNPSYFQGSQRPVETLNWFGAVDYCNALSDREGLTRAYTVSGSTVTWNRAANGYRLPTESEWEYACRAGTTTQYWSGESQFDAARVAWCWYNSGSQTHDVKGKEANAWGLYDMPGNVWEWCWDWYNTYPAGTQEGPAVDPAGPASKTHRVLRGGSWSNDANKLRCANRGGYLPEGSYNPYYGGFGFRVARTVTP